MSITEKQVIIKTMDGVRHEFDLDQMLSWDFDAPNNEISLYYKNNSFVCFNKQYVIYYRVKIIKKGD